MPDLTRLLLDQLEFYLEAHLLPRLQGLDDEEYLWQPVPGCWSVVEGRDGWVLEGSWPEPEPPPMTTVAWRLAHIAANNIGTRANAFFGDAPMAAGETFNDARFTPPPPGSADEAREMLTLMWRRWRDGLLDLGDDRLMAPIGAGGGPYADQPLAALVLHVSRETMHHGGEVGVLRDLYRARRPDAPLRTRS